MEQGYDVQVIRCCSHSLPHPGGGGGGEDGGRGELCLEAETVDKAAAGLVQPGDLMAFLQCWPVQ